MTSNNILPRNGGFINSIGDLLSEIEEATDKPTQEIETGKFKAYCPVHGDEKTPDLDIEEEADKVLMHCHSCKCKGKDVMESIGLSTRLLFKENWNKGRAGSPAPSPKHPPKTCYNYKDENGELLYQIVRENKGNRKTFKARRKDKQGNWQYGLSKQQRIPYRLPDVKQAAQSGDRVAIVEGEKDVDNLRSIGITATCNPFGAGKWREDYSKHLKGARVVVIPDNDEGGQQHATQVCEFLRKENITPKLLHLPDLDKGEDVSDWLEKGGTKEELEQLIKEAPRYGQNKKPDLVSLSDVEAEETEWLWEPYIPLKKITLLEGDPGVGKTFLALQLAATISNGYPLLDAKGKPTQENPPGRVLYISAEDGIEDTLVPRLEKLNANKDNIIALRGTVDTETQEKGYFTLDDDYVLADTLEDVEPSLVIIDPIQGFLGEDVDMHRANEIRPIMQKLNDMANRFNTAILIIRHLTKGGKDKAIYRGLGSIDFTAAVRSVLIVGADPDNNKEKVMTHAKSNLAPKGPSIGYELTEEGGFYWTGTSELTPADILQPETGQKDKSPREKAKEFIKNKLSQEGLYPSKKLKDEAKEIGISRATLFRAKDELPVDAVHTGGGWSWFWAGEEGNGEVDRGSDIKEIEI